MREATPLSKMVGRRLRGLRRARALSQAAVGAQVGARHQTVAKWEDGENVPPLERLVKLASVFDVTLDYFVQGAPAQERIAA